jgi:hypothetical protein
VPFPEPKPGLVIRYSYLWSSEQALGKEEGRKDRPCAIILVSSGAARAPRVTVLPVTHHAPSDPSLAVELPSATKRRLGLDDARSWVILSEANIFTWPGPDLRAATAGKPETVAYGMLPYALFETIRLKLIAAVQAHRLRAVPRTE